MNRQTWTETERQAYQDVAVVALAAATGTRNDAGTRQASRLAHRVTRELADRDVAWATRALDNLTEDGWYIEIKRIRKDLDKHRVNTTSRGLRRRTVVAGARARARDGSVAAVQMSLFAMTADELTVARERYARQGIAAQENVALAAKLLDLLARYPAATTAAEALDLAGLSIDEFLAS